MKKCDEDFGGMSGVRAVKLKDVKHGECFKLTNSAKAPVWLRGGYDHSSKKFNCSQYWDANHENQFKPDRVVYVGFSF